MFDFTTNNDKITIKYRWGSESAVSSALGSWQRPGVGS